MRIAKTPGKHWHATGWLCKNGRAINYELFIPGGARAEIRLIEDENERPIGWAYRIGGHAYDNWRGADPWYRSASEASLAAEHELRKHLTAALAMLDRKKGVGDPRPARRLPDGPIEAHHV